MARKVPERLDKYTVFYLSPVLCSTYGFHSGLIIGCCARHYCSLVYHQVYQKNTGVSRTSLTPLRKTDLYETTVKKPGSFIVQYIDIIANVPDVAVVLIEK